MSVLRLRQVLLAFTLVSATIAPSTGQSSSSSRSRDLPRRRLPPVPGIDLLEERTTGIPPVASSIRTTVAPHRTVENQNVGTSIHRHSEQYEAIQRHVLQRTVEAVVKHAAAAPSTTPTSNSTSSHSSSSSYRSNSIQRVCSPDANGVVFPDDDFNIQLFRDDAEPMCSCYERDNTELVLYSLVKDKSANVSEYLQKLNQAFSRIVGVIEYECANTCEHCFTTFTNNITNESDTFCGLLQTNESSTYRGTEANFSMEEYSTGKITAATWEHLFSESSFSTSTCIEYTQNEVGTLCYGSHFWNISTTPTCYVKYNDSLCQSCVFAYNPLNDVNVTNNDCFIVDCTNIVPNSSVINTCNNSGYDGIFRFVEWIENGVSNTTNARTVTVGSCDGPPTPVPVAAPVVSIEQAAPSFSVPTPTIIPTTTSSSGPLTMCTFAPFTVMFISLIIGGLTARVFYE